MKIPHCILLMICISFGCYAQSKLDSLKEDLSKAKIDGDQKMEVYRLFQVAYYFHNAYTYDSAIHYYNEMLEKAPDKIYEASALNGIGAAYSNKGVPAQSIPYYTQAIALYEELKDTTNATTAALNLAAIYKDMGLYENALEISYSNLSKLEKQAPSRTLASCYNTIGTVYIRIHDYEKALDFYRKSLAVRKSIGYEQGVAQSLGNLGELFNEMKQYDSALNNLQKAVEIRRKLGDKRGLGRTLTVIGSTFNQSGKQRESISQLTEALSFNRISEDNVGEILTLHELSVVHTSLKDFVHAEQDLISAQSLISKTQTHDYLKRNLELQANLYREKGDTKKLVNSLDRLAIVKDSLFNQEKVESLLALDIQYETEKKQQQIVLLQQQRKVDEAELEKSKLQIIGLVIFAILLFVGALLSYRLYSVTQREKKSAELHSQEMHHRTKNNLQMLSSFFTIQASILEDDKKAQELIVDTQGRVKTMALVHDKLYQGADASELNLREYITDLVTSLLYTYGYNENTYKLDLNIIDVNTDIDKAVRIGLIINELITNALKYAYEGQKEPMLKISLSKTNDMILIEVGDNGLRPLTSASFENGKSFGLKMVNLFVRELKGQIELRNDHGTSFLITIP
ncbi:MAG: tetratricopeptide repeat protein [Bacteroidota bacterium]